LSFYHRTAKNQVKASRPEIKPQQGPQTEFLTTEASIAIYGGSAGGGKSFSLLLEPLRHIDNGKFGAVIFRKTSVQVKNTGGLWDESEALYTQIGGYPRKHVLKWSFPSGMNVTFAHLEYDKDVYNYQGSQIPLIGFDELTHFTEKQFFYMMSRNRSMSGVPGYVRATCNPDCDSWVRKFIDWWIGDDGYPNKERAGKLRWFIRVNDSIIWANTEKELIDQYGSEQMPKSVTFIPASLLDNKILMQKDPSYLSNLMSLGHVDRLRLLGGNWNIRPTAGNYFKREWFTMLDAIPSGWTSCCRFWDRAATKPHESNKDPDWTRGLKLYKYPNGTWLIGDLKSTQDTPFKVEQLIKQTAQHDGQRVKISCQQDPGSAGVAEAHMFTSMLVGYDVHTRTFSKDKITRAKAVSAQCEAGNVFVLKADWNDDLFSEVENFPEGRHDDIVDVLSGAFNELNSGHSILDVL
jgi:predicted phage terminase large subunit-like protein